MNNYNYKELWEVFWLGYYHRSNKEREKYFRSFLSDYISDRVFNNKAK